MNIPIRPNTQLHQYLKSKGLIPGGSAAKIKQAKRAFKKEYQRSYRKQRRKERPEVTVQLSKEEKSRLEASAKVHHLTLASFLRESALAYQNQTFLVPDPGQLADLEQRLRLLQTDLRLMVKWFNRLENHEMVPLYEALTGRIQLIESRVDTMLRYPRQIGGFREEGSDAL